MSSLSVTTVLWNCVFLLFVIITFRFLFMSKGWSQVSGSLLQPAQTWANAGVCSASCAHAFGCMFVCLFVCLFVIACLFVCFTGNLGDWVL